MANCFTGIGLNPDKLILKKNKYLRISDPKNFEHVTHMTSTPKTMLMLSEPRISKPGSQRVPAMMPKSLDEVKEEKPKKVPLAPPLPPTIMSKSANEEKPKKVPLAPPLPPTIMSKSVRKAKTHEESLESKLSSTVISKSVGEGKPNEEPLGYDYRNELAKHLLLRRERIENDADGDW